MTHEPLQPGVPPTPTITDRARAHVLAQLSDACHATHAAHALSARTLLDDAAAQVDAWATAHHALPAPTRTLLARESVEILAEFLLIPFGDIEVERPIAGDSFTFTAEHARAAKQWFDRLGRKLVIDYEHQSFDDFNTRTDGLRPAAGWIANLDVREDGLWATQVTWTDRAKELINAGEYRYFSPVIYWSDENYTTLIGLGPVALTNDPAMRNITELVPRRNAADMNGDGGEGDLPDGDGLVDNLPTGGGHLRRAQPALAADSPMEEQVTVLRAQLRTLRKRLRAQEADAFVERGLRLGKITDATSLDWRDDYLRDADVAELRLSRAPVILPPGRVIDRDVPATLLNRATARRELLGGTSWGAEAEDLAAYERAAAAGRIRHYQL